MALNLQLPDTAHTGDAGHTDDHNLIVAALRIVESHIDALEAVPTPPPWTGGSAIYGPGITADALGNTQVGGGDSGCDHNEVSIFFTAEYTSTLEGFACYWLGWGVPGYGAGNGGTYTITLETDDDGVPSGTVLATRQFSMTPYETSYFGEIAWTSTKPSVTKGVKYHLRFVNNSGSPSTPSTTHYSSLNHLYQFSPTNPRCPKYTDSEFGLIRKWYDPDGDWGSDASDGDYIPILDLRYGNGRHGGNGYMEVEYDDGDGSGLCARMDATGAQETRLRFTPNLARQVSGVHVRIAKESGGSGDCTFTLKQGATTLGSVVVDGAGLYEADYEDAATDAAGTYEGGDFASPVNLQAGVEYTLHLTGVAGAKAWTRPIQSGYPDWGLHPEAAFSELDSNGDVTVVLECRDTANTADEWEEPEGTAGCGCLQFYFT